MRKEPITQLMCFERESALRMKHGRGIASITPHAAHMDTLHAAQLGRKASRR